MIWLLDADVFIQAKNLHYGFEFCPAFWRWLEGGGAQVFSIEAVYEELVAGDDELKEWAVAQGSTFFKPFDEPAQVAFGEVAGWTESAGYERSAVAEFLRVADSQLVAHARQLRATVVTHEVASNSRAKLKVPDACRGLQVQCTSPFEMLRRAQARFVLGPRP